MYISNAFCATLQYIVFRNFLFVYALRDI